MPAVPAAAMWSRDGAATSPCPADRNLRPAVRNRTTSGKSVGCVRARVALENERDDDDDDDESAEADRDVAVHVSPLGSGARVTKRKASRFPPIRNRTGAASSRVYTNRKRPLGQAASPTGAEYPRCPLHHVKTPGNVALEAVATTAKT